VTRLDLPDLPRWVEAHGVAADPDGWREPLGSGLAIGHDATRVIIIAGDADADAAAALVAARPTHAVVFGGERDDLVAAFEAKGRVVARVIVHTLADAEALSDLEGAALLGDAEVTDVPPELAAELAWARARGPIWAVWVDAAPQSFAYALWRSPGWFDITIETLPGYRQLGLGTLAVTAMIHAERAAGREPVWAADEDNVASLALARRLGFTPSDEIWVAAPR
jgi:hypothetical protein